MWVLSLRIHSSGDSSMDSRIFPVRLVSLHPHILLWTLKSPISMMGIGSFSIKFSISVLFSLCFGGM